MLYCDYKKMAMRLMRCKGQRDDMNNETITHIYINTLSGTMCLGLEQSSHLNSTSPNWMDSAEPDFDITSRFREEKASSGCSGPADPVPPRGSPEDHVDRTSRQLSPASGRAVGPPRPWVFWESRAPLDLNRVAEPASAVSARLPNPRRRAGPS